MTQELIIIALIVLVIYLYYQNRKLQNSSGGDFSSDSRIIFNSESEEDLVAEKDLAIRQKNEAEQEVLSLSNKLKLKHQEVTRKEEEIARLKKEKSNSEIALNKKISEKNGLINTLQREINQHKQKHTQQLKAINLLFDPQVKDYSEIDFEGLYSLLEKKS